MSQSPVDLCVRISLAHASLALKLDVELGTYHGLSLGDFIVLRLLASAEDGRMAVTDLQRPMGMQLSAVTRELVRLEKIGWIQRQSAGDDAVRVAAIRPVGRRLLNEALATAEAVCADALRGVWRTPRQFPKHPCLTSAAQRRWRPRGS